MAAVRGVIGGNAGAYAILKFMTHHHHETGHGHPARAVSPSLLRMSAAGRFVAALAIAGVLWGAVWWVMR